MSTTVQQRVNFSLATQIRDRTIRTPEQFDAAASKVIQELKQEGLQFEDAVVLEGVPSQWRNEPSGLTTPQLSSQYLQSIGVQADALAPHLLDSFRVALDQRQPIATLSQLEELAAFGPPPKPRLIDALQALGDIDGVEGQIALAQVAGHESEHAKTQLGLTKELAPDLPATTQSAFTQAALRTHTDPGDVLRAFDEISNTLGDQPTAVHVGLTHASAIHSVPPQEAIRMFELAKEILGPDASHRMLTEATQTLISAQRPGREDMLIEAFKDAAATFLDAGQPEHVAYGIASALVLAEGAVRPEHALEVFNGIEKRFAGDPNASRIAMGLTQTAIANSKGAPEDMVSRDLEAATQEFARFFDYHLDHVPSSPQSFRAALHLTQTDTARNPEAEYLAMIKPWNTGLFGVALY